MIFGALLGKRGFANSFPNDSDNVDKTHDLKKMYFSHIFYSASLFCKINRLAKGNAMGH